MHCCLELWAILLWALHHVFASTGQQVLQQDPHILHAELHGVGFDEPYQDGNPEEETSQVSQQRLRSSSCCHKKAPNGFPLQSHAAMRPGKVHMVAELLHP
ncbi:unnamed protein product [Durusdinium trenchii]|uniref:Uncharacterized protein n=1 Tax=Durusdinium trenchii TaxID=1381693 RepID=A0ABP0NX51_9DINO